MAIKSPRAALHVDKNSQSFRGQLRDAYFELQVLSHPPLRAHNNIVKLLGISWEPSPVSLSGFHGPETFWPVLVIEHSEYGTIQDVFEDIEANNTTPLTVETKVNLCLDVARGLEALHHCGIVHGDVKCENILIFRQHPRTTAKLADFGCALSDVKSKAELKGLTEPWDAPEARNTLTGRGLMATDTYSLGFTLWRILGNGKNPFTTAVVLDAMKGQSIKDFKKRDELWKLACADIAQRGDFNAWMNITGAASSGLKQVESVFEKTLRYEPSRRTLSHSVELLIQAQNLCVILSLESIVCLTIPITASARKQKRKP